MKKAGYLLIGIAVVALMFYTGVIKININITNSHTTQTTNDSSGANKYKDVKEFLNAYDAFVDEYSEFSENYDPKDFSAAMKSTEFTSKALNFAVEADKYAEEEMSEADAAFFKEERARIEAKLEKVSANNQ